MNRVAFHTQLASIMEVLANAAVAEICKLVDDGYAVLRFEMSQTQKENKALKRRLQMIEPRVVRGCAERTNTTDTLVNNPPEGVQVCDKLRGTEVEGDFTNEGRVFGKQLDKFLWKNGEPMVEEDEQDPSQPVMMDESLDVDEGESESLLIKEEDLGDEDVHGGPGVREKNTSESRAGVGATAPSSSSQTTPAKGSEGQGRPHRTRRCVMEVSGLETVLKAEPEKDNVNKMLQHTGSEHSAGRLNNPYSDYTLYHRNSHPRTYFTRGGHQAETEDPSCSYATEMDSEGLSFHSELQSVTLPTAEEGAGDGLSLGSLDVKPELVMVDSVPDEVESEMRSAWNKESMCLYTQQRQNREKRPEKTANARGPQFQTPARQDVVEPKSNALDVNGYAPRERGFSAPKNSKNKVGAREKLFICTFCGKAFNRPKKVEIHQRVHTGEKPFRCTLCGKWFAESGNLKKHQRVHTGEKPFSCNYCGRRFAWIRNLKTHQQRNHL